MMITALHLPLVDQSMYSRYKMALLLVLNWVVMKLMIVIYALIHWSTRYWGVLRRPLIALLLN